MSEAINLIRKLIELGLTLTVEGDKLKCRGRTEALDADLRSAIEKHKDAVIDAIRAFEKRSAVVPAEQDILTGPVELGPRQTWFFDQRFSHPERWNQAVLLRIRDPAHAQLVGQCLVALMNHHDALRMIFQVDGRDWKAEYGPAVREAPLWEIYASDDDQHSKEHLSEAVESAQASLDLAAGRLLRGLLIRRRHSVELLVVIHHLVVDGISWRVLLEDLAKLLRQAAQGVPLDCGPKSHSYRAWTEKAWKLAQQPHLSERIKPWAGHLPTQDWPLDFNTEEGANTTASELSAKTKLSEAETNELRTAAPGGARAGLVEVLLTALGEACAQTWNLEDIWINLEGHGRGDLFEDIDIGRTVGWFTSIHPFAVRIGEPASLSDALRGIQDRLGRIPFGGAEYDLFTCLGAQRASTRFLPLTFNFLGQEPLSGHEDAPFVVILDTDATGRQRHPEQHRVETMAINCGIVGNELLIECLYSDRLHKEETILGFLERFRIIVTETVSELNEYTCSHALENLARLDAGELEALARECGPLEAVWPLTPMQKGFVFASVGNSTTFVEQTLLDIRGVAGNETLTRAWRAIVADEPLLRGRVAFTGREPVFFVPQHAEPAIHLEDARTNNGIVRAEDIAASVRESGFEVQRGRLHSLWLVQVENARWIAIWSFHHLLMDGWSNARLIRRWLAVLAHGEVREEPRFDIYLKWLARQEHAAAYDHWRTYLNGHELIPRLPTVSVAKPKPEPDFAVQRSVARSEITDNLRNLCRRNRVSLNTTMNSVWALLLSKMTDSNQVIWGKTVAGRSIDHPKADDILGLMINTIPCRFRIQPETGFWENARRLQMEAATSLDNAFLSTAEIHHACGARGRLRLFDTLFVFENFPLQAGRVEPLPGDGSVRVMNELGGNTPYALTVVAFLQEKELHVKLLYDQTRIAEVAAADIGAAFSRLLAALADGTDSLERLRHNIELPTPISVYSYAEPVAGAGIAEAAPRGNSTSLQHSIAGICAEVLDQETVDVHRNLFELGAHSLALTEIADLLQKRLNLQIHITDLFAHPTIATLAERFENKIRIEGRGVRRRSPHGPGRDGIAVVGMALKFPGADSPDDFLKLLQEGREGIRHYTPAQLEAASVPEWIWQSPDYVRAKGTLDGLDLFDAEHFQITPIEAEVIDPQQRVFLETVYNALGDAGYMPENYNGRIGIYGGSGINLYFLMHLVGNPEVKIDPFQVQASNVLDQLCTRVAYKLNLRGPAITLQTACSTSLVAMHYAAEALRREEVDIAICGAVSFGGGYEDAGVPRGIVLSPDGHCRPFDAAAAGTVLGQGCGVVVLKRLAESEADGDHVYAVLRGTAVNNDGSLKPGFTTPSVKGQVEVIRMAHDAAGIGSHEIGYVEAHGTATPLGDPIEVAALTEVFGERPDRRIRCGLGSVKSNLGHLDAAAGMAGFIKTVLALRHQQLFPSLHFNEANPKINFAGGPFYVVDRLQTWDAGSGAPRRAGVSSFGVGGTNAHVVLEEYRKPDCDDAPARDGCLQLIPLSAWSKSQLRSYCSVVAQFLRCSLDGGTPASLADLAFTYQTGRQHLPERAAFLVSALDGLVAGLEAAASGQTDVPDVLFGNARSGEDAGAAALKTDPAASEESLRSAARAWCSGRPVAWPQRTAQEARPCRISCPTLPLRRKRHWVERRSDWDILGLAGFSKASAPLAPSGASAVPEATPPESEDRSVGSREDPLDLVTALLARSLKISPDLLTPETSLEELGTDSIVILHFLEMLEAATGRVLAMADLQQTATVRSISEAFAVAEGPPLDSPKPEGAVLGRAGGSSRAGEEARPPDTTGTGASTRLDADLKRLAVELLSGRMTATEAVARSISARGAHMKETG